MGKLAQVEADEEEQTDIKKGVTVIAN
jgi:hypothetical protein